MLPVPQASGILASLGQAAFLWDLTADTIAWSDNAGAVFTDIPPEALASGAGFARLIEPSAFDPDRGARPIGAGAGRRRRRLPDRIWRADLDLRARDLDRGDRLLVCRARRQAGARARHRPRQQ